MCNYFGKTIILNLHKTSDEVSDSGYFVFADLAVPVKRKVSPDANCYGPAAHCTFERARGPVRADPDGDLNPCLNPTGPLHSHS